MSQVDAQFKVFGIGLDKTGTASLGDALNLLGIKCIHYPRDNQTFEELRRPTYNLSILDTYQAIVDIPVAPYYAQLDQAYPGSKFILTIREKESWLRSMEVHRRLMEPKLDRDPSLKEFTLFMYACVYGATGFHRERYSFVYDLHVRNALDYFRDRPEDFLVLDICGGEGWEKLCSFLRLPVPAAPFPHSNRWMHDYVSIRGDMARVIPADRPFILADEGLLGPEVTEGLRVVPFLERDGQYGGLPPDDATAIRELERLREQGSTAVVFPWIAAWWFDYYTGFRDHLRRRYRCVLETDRLVVFDLQQSAPFSEGGDEGRATGG